MKNIKVINLENESQKIVDSLQEFYGDKAEVSLMEITDKPLNVHIFFCRGWYLDRKMDIKKLYKELVESNRDSRFVVYYDGGGEKEMIYHAKLYSMYGPVGSGFPYDNSICLGHLLESTWYAKDRLLEFLIPSNDGPSYPSSPPPRDEWAEY